MGNRYGSLEAIDAEARRRRETGDGCGDCAYCELGAFELCRGYDLILAAMLNPTDGPMKGQDAASDDTPGMDKTQ